MFFVTVDAHSKGVEVYNTGQPSRGLMTVHKLRPAFVQHGLPEDVVSDNGPCFTSRVFSKFLTQNGIQHIKNLGHITQLPIVWQNVPFRH